MNAPRLYLLAFACMALFIGACASQATAQTLRQVEMETYRVISSAPKKEIING
jgi:hypothetical protein